MLGAIFIIEPGVSDKQHQIACHHAHGLPTLFAIFNSVLPAQMQWILKHPLRCLKTNAVFSRLLALLPSSQENTGSFIFVTT